MVKEEIEDLRKKIKKENPFSSGFIDTAQWNLLLTLTQDPHVSHIGGFQKLSQYE